MDLHDNRSAVEQNVTASCVQLAQPGLLVVQNVILFFTASLSVPMNIIVASLLHGTSAVHPNVALLKLNVAVANIIHAMYNVGHCINNFVLVEAIRTNSMPPGLWDNLTQQDCSLIELLYTLSFSSLVFSGVAIGLERLLALTIRQKLLTQDAEHSDALSRLLVAASWLWSVPILLPSLARPSSERRRVCYCHSVLISESDSFLASTICSFLLILVSLCLCLLVHRLSTSRLAARKSGNRTLTERFQLNRSLTTANMLHAWLLCHCLCYIFALALRIPVFSWMSDNRDDYGLGLHLLLLNSQCLAIFDMFYPVSTIRHNGTLAKVLVGKHPQFARFGFGITAKVAVDKAAASTKVINHSFLQQIVKDHVQQQVRVTASVSNGEASGSRSRLSQPTMFERKPAFTRTSGVTEYRISPEYQETVLSQFWKK